MRSSTTSLWRRISIPSVERFEDRYLLSGFLLSQPPAVTAPVLSGLSGGTALRVNQATTASVVVGGNATSSVTPALSANVHQSISLNLPVATVSVTTSGSVSTGVGAGQTVEVAVGASATSGGSTTGAAPTSGTDAGVGLTMDVLGSTTTGSLTGSATLGFNGGTPLFGNSTSADLAIRVNADTGLSNTGTINLSGGINLGLSGSVDLNNPANAGLGYRADLTLGTQVPSGQGVDVSAGLHGGGSTINGHATIGSDGVSGQFSVGATGTVGVGVIVDGDSGSSRLEAGWVINSDGHGQTTQDQGDGDLGNHPADSGKGGSYGDSIQIFFGSNNDFVSLHSGVPFGAGGPNSLPPPNVEIPSVNNSWLVTSSLPMGKEFEEDLVQISMPSDSNAEAEAALGDPELAALLVLQTNLLLGIGDIDRDALALSLANSIENSAAATSAVYEGAANEGEEGVIDLCGESETRVADLLRVDLGLLGLDIDRLLDNLRQLAGGLSGLLGQARLVSWLLVMVAVAAAAEITRQQLRRHKRLPILANARATTFPWYPGLPGSWTFEEA